ncbi:MAG: carboxypeptidase regulatory-like domain-containing protein, partial [Nitrospirota bacterium]
SISGTVTSGGSPIQGVTISGSGGCPGFTTTNSNGDYTLAGIPDGSTCTVTPSKSAYTFTPTSRTVTINGANVTGQDFEGTPGAITYSISGYVKTPDTARPGSPISGVTMTLSGTGCSGSTSTSSNGTYIFTGLSDGVTCTVTPSKTGYTFSPASRSVTINNANVTGQDFVRQ